jgi:hypothetical protein
MASSASLIPLQAIRRSGNSSTTRIGDPFEERDFEDPVGQRSFATGASVTSGVSRDHGGQTEPSLPEQWEDERTDFGADEQLRFSDYHDEERSNVAAVDRLLSFGPTSRNSERNELGAPEGQDFGVSGSDAVASTPARCREINTRSTIGQAALDLCILSASVYFIALAVMAPLYSGRETDTFAVKAVLRAARLVSSLHSTLP